MSTVFISHVEADAAVAEAVADCLSQAGYDAWCYERNSLPGVPYITQVLTALGESAAVVVVLSKDALASLQVDKEIIRAYEGNKPFVPLLLGLTHAEFRAHKPEWGMMLGASTSVAVPPEGVATIVPRMVEGLKAMGSTRRMPLAQRRAHLRRLFGLKPRQSGLRRCRSHIPWPPAAVLPPSRPVPGRHPRQPGTKPWPLIAAGGVVALLVAGGVVFAAARPSAQSPASVPGGAPSGQAAVPLQQSAPPPQGAANTPPSSAGASPGTLLRSDDFSDPAHGLFAPSGRGSSGSTSTGARAPYDYSYSGGALLGHIGPLSIPASGLRLGPRIAARDKVDGDFALEVRARATTSSNQVGYSLLFQPGADPYAFGVTPGGGEYSLFPTTTGRLLSGRSPAIAGGDQENLLRLEVRADTITMFANGLLMDRLQRQEFALRPATVGVGFFITTAPADGTAEVRFQDFKVIALS